MEMKQYIYANNIFFEQTDINIIVDIIDQCNQSCYYCYNRQPRTLKTLDLNKLYKFLLDLFNLRNKHINVFLIGGEPTLHPDLVEFCEKIKDKQFITCIILTNLAQSIQFYRKLLNYNCKIYATWHSIPSDLNNTLFINKSEILFKDIEEDKYKIQVMYENLNIQQSLNAFNILANVFKSVELSIIDSNHITINDINNKKLLQYSKEDINKLKNIITSKIYKKNLHKYCIEYRSKNRKDFYTLTELILNNKLLNFYNYKCMAGSNQLQIYVNGNISPCDDLYGQNVIIGNIFNDINTIKFRYRICQLKHCTCPMFSKKEKII